MVLSALYVGFEHLESPDNNQIITKTSLFKYTENFTTQKMKMFR